MQQIRFALASLDPGSVAHQAQDEPAEATIYPVRGHDSALTFDRPLVVGNRGMGKSFWAAVLSHQEGRKRASELYPRARLDGLQVALGFHEAAGKRSGRPRTISERGRRVAAAKKDRRDNLAWCIAAGACRNRSSAAVRQPTSLNCRD